MQLIVWCKASTVLYPNTQVPYILRGRMQFESQVILKGGTRRNTRWTQIFSWELNMGQALF